MPCILHTLYHLVYTMQYTVYTMHGIHYIILCNVYSVWIVRNACSILYNVHRIIIQYALYSTEYTIQYTMYSTV